MSDLQLIIPSRFCGPPGSGNGGWTAGALADVFAALHADGQDPGAVEVSLRQPPPLDTTLAVSVEADGATASLNDAPVAIARVVGPELIPVDPVGYERAAAVSASFPGHTEHPFATCFVCGTDRAEGDGLRIFPGLVNSGDPGRTRVAAPWTPHASLVAEGPAADGAVASRAATWAALDCAGGWAGDFGTRPMVLARMTARIDAFPLVGEPHVVVGESRGSEGRKTWSATTLYDSHGRVVGTAEHLWITINPADFV